MEGGEYKVRTCFVAGTIVTVVKREYFDTILLSGESMHPNAHYEEKVAIETVKVGDVVLSKDEDSGKLLYKAVTELFINKVDYIRHLGLTDGSKLEVTWNHPIFVKGKGWTEVKDIRIGDSLLLSDSREAIVSFNNTLSSPDTTVYNFEVGDTHSYFVGDSGVWVHNYAISLLPGKNGYAISVSGVGLLDSLKLYFDPARDFADGIGYPIGMDEKDVQKIALDIYKKTYKHEVVIDPDGTLNAGKNDKGENIARILIRQRLDVIINDHLVPSLRLGEPAIIRGNSGRTPLSEKEDLQIRMHLIESHMLDKEKFNKYFPKRDKLLNFPGLEKKRLKELNDYLLKIKQDLMEIDKDEKATAV